MEEIATLMMVTYNRLELTKQTLNNIITNTKYPYNFVIVDNNSTDGTQEYLKEFREACNLNIVLILNDENKGIAVGRNQGLLEANKLNTVWYSTVDNDILLPEKWLTRCISLLKADKRFAMIGVNFEERQYPILKIGNEEIQYKHRGNLGTACTVFHKSFHKMVGFFNTEYGLYGEEDADMGARAQAIGLKLGYLKENGVHLGEGDADQGEYREFKTESHKRNLQKFNENARDYFQRRKSLYIPCKGC